MLVSGSNCCEWNFNKGIGGGETLDKMGNDEFNKADAEEGEISDSASVEEISAEDFKQEAKPKVEDGGRRVWTMQDLYQYQACRGYPSASGLYNLAWAQAVQNKPLNDIFVMDVDPDDNSKRSSPSSSVASVNSSGKVDKVVIDDSGDEMDVEKEDGELEEGEIDLDSEPAEKQVGNDDQLIVDSSEIDFAEEVKSIREELDSVTVVDAEKSFEQVCSKLQSSIQRVQKVVFGCNASAKESLVQLSFTAVQVLNSVFLSMDHNLKERNKDVYSRLLSFLKSNYHPLFSSDQMKELEVTMAMPESLDVLGNGGCYKVTQINNGVHKEDHDMANAGHVLSSTDKLPLDSVTVALPVHNNQKMTLETSKPGFSNFRCRGLLAPLLDLHKDHDVDSLPSPTREAPPSFPMHRTSPIGSEIDNMEFTRPKVSHSSHNSIVHPYETDAVKAVSSYQQKFNRGSFHMFDRLPSPTPSEESDDVDGDVSGEVSSSSTISSFKTAYTPTLGRPVVSLSMDSPSRQGLVTTGNAAPLSSSSNPTIKPSANSRDPRLRFASSDVTTSDLNQRPLMVMPNSAKLANVVGNMDPRKQKAAEEPVVGGPALKRQKNGLEGSGIQRDVKPSSGTGGWLDDTDSFGPQPIIRHRLIENARTDPRKIDKGPTFSSTGSGRSVIGANNQIPVTSASTAASLPALLKDIAVNPTMLLNMLKMGQQQRLTEEARQKSSYPATPHPPSSKSAAVALENVTSSNVPGFLPKSVEPLQVSSVSLQDESGKIRMKPRDPRRFLHGNTTQNNGSLVSEQFKSNGASTSNTKVVKDNIIAPKPEGQQEINQAPHVSVAPPDIARQFTNNLKNIANMISVSQSLPNPIPPAIPVDLSAVQTKLENSEAKSAVKNSEDQQNRAVSAPDVAVGPSSQNSWGDVDLLFEGYDDREKADIQRERARRIEEQNKMFAAHKLCLVLDLDHTLLNSAKFGEVDPVHDEILRKKEEQDRDKPHRHLFRFSHMGMWTKLRPGIWTFLERASKMFELHLYTMGNKVYATEMAKVLDPKGVLFAGRVISKGDDGDLFDGDDRLPKIKDLEGVLGMESGVLIIDDSIRVWPHNRPNLIVVERYTYFPCSRRQFGLPGPSLLEIDHDERPEDGTIASCLAVIERVHQNFFSHPSLEEVDVRAILASEQRKILANCRIVFSRVFPVGEANPQLHPLWQTAEQFGAVCTNQIDEQVTHVVANSLGTDKVNWALSTGRFVVYPGWVEASALLYRRANEQDFAIKP